MTNYSIIIPTFNRPRFLACLLEYYSSYDEVLEIVIADSSSEQTRKANKNILKKYSKIKFVYLDYSSDKNPAYKFSDMVQNISSEYAVICADDDFICLPGIKKCINFLEHNRDYVVAHGLHIAFKAEKNTNGISEFSWRSAYLRKSIDCKNPVDRFKYHFLNYLPTIYAVHRSKTLKKIFSEWANSETDPNMFAELLSSFLTPIYGKIKSLDFFFSASRDDSTFSPTLRIFADFVKQPNFDLEYGKFKKCILSNFKNVGVTIDGYLIDELMQKYIKKETKPNFKHSVLTGSIRFLKKIKTPSNIYTVLRNIYRQFFVPEKKVRNPTIIRDYAPELEKIKKASLKSI